MKSARKWAKISIAAGVVALWAPTAFAQDEAPAAEPAPAPAPAPVQTQAQAGFGAQTQPAAAPPPAAAPAAQPEGASDHDAVVGRLGVGFLGRRSMRLGDELAPADPTWPNGSTEIDAPVIGIRYWVAPLIGIDAGIGFVHTSGESTVTPGATPAVSTDEAGINAFLLHAGVPLSLTSAQHFSFQIVPELNVGFASQTVKPPAGDPQPFDTEHKGFHFDIGARAGAEIHFGFMDIPQLSLQGSVGVLFETDSISTTFKAAPEQKYEASHSSIRTTVGDNPWNIFLANVAALYYF
jgi:hypothetical protein